MRTVPFVVRALRFGYLARRLLPGSWAVRLREFVISRRNYRKLKDNFRYDYVRFNQHASPFRKLDRREHFRSYVTMLFHSIEKGLAMPNPRPGFGREKVNELLINVEDYLEHYGEDPLADAAISAIEAYIAFNRKNGLDSTEFGDRLANIRSRLQVKMESGHGGIRKVLAEDIKAAACIDLTHFFEYRFSVRNFSDAPVNNDVICEAIRMATKAPSVCNRQSGRVYVFDNDDLGTKILACQQGNNGFGHEARKILVVCSELGAFLSVGERNQCWIDGGMFAMSLIYALHSKGLGTCCLNWSVKHESDERLRRVAGIADSENIIMLVAVGHLPDHLRVAYSQRKPLEQIARFR